MEDGNIYIDENHIKELKIIINETIERIRNNHFDKETKQQNLTNSYLYHLCSLATSITGLIEHKKSYEACVLASHATEALILYRWTLEDINRMDDFVDFGIVKILENRDLTIANRDEILNKIKERNIARFLIPNVKKNNSNLLNRKNYYKYWYKTYKGISTIENMVQELEKDSNNYFFRNIKNKYDMLCDYKHYCCYNVLPTELDEDIPLNIGTYASLDTTGRMLITMVDYSNYFQPIDKKILVSDLGKELMNIVNLYNID